MIRRLLPEDAEAYAALRLEMLLDSPLSFASSPEDDLASGPEAARAMLTRPASVLFGAFLEEEERSSASSPGLAGLLGAVGIYRDQKRKFAHKVHIWGMYVRPAHRRRGLAAELLDAAIAHARIQPDVSWVHLSVSSTAPSAKRLYERAGFRVWGTEPDAMRHAGLTSDEHHLALAL